VTGAPRRARIGVVVPSLAHEGGVATVTEFVCETLERSGRFDVTLVSLPSSARDPLGVALTRPSTWFRGVRTEHGVWRGRSCVSVGAFACELEFQRYRPRRALTQALAGCDLVQIVTGLPAPGYAACGLGRPVAVYCATRASVERRARHAARRTTAEIWRRVMTRIIDSIDRRVLARADAVHSMNPWMLEYAREINAGRDIPIRLVQPGIDASQFTPAAGVDRLSQPYVLSVGRFNDPRKHVGLLLDAFAALAARVTTPVRLVLAGFFGPDEGFWREADRLGLRDRVSFVDSPDRRALIALYQRAAVFALSSDEEGFGMVVVEAMACGIPVVSTASGGPDAIIRDGVDGFLVPLGGAAPLADRLERLVVDGDLNRRMGAAAREAVVARFDAARAGQALLETYDRLLSGVT
jgi:glycosyltransferase involved in cell wall biosynthesis